MQPAVVEVPMEVHLVPVAQVVAVVVEIIQVVLEQTAQRLVVVAAVVEG
jgi:hypothetical protein